MLFSPVRVNDPILQRVCSVWMFCDLGVALHRVAEIGETLGRLLWYEGDSNSASLNVALNAATLFIRYAPYSNNTAKTTQYRVRPGTGRHLDNVRLLILRDLCRISLELSWITPLERIL
jgi:hypothetical protein